MKKTIASVVLAIASTGAVAEEALNSQSVDQQPVAQQPVAAQFNKPFISDGLNNPNVIIGLGAGIGGALGIGAWIRNAERPTSTNTTVSTR